jgi:hypothetical protein
MDHDKIKNYLRIRSSRLELTKQVNLLQKEEDKLAAEILPQVPQLGEIKEGGFTLRRKTKVKPSVGDWGKFYEYIRSNNAFDLLHRRVTETAVKLRWDDKVEIPGVEAITDESLEVSKDE